jgi:hypothetical protein
LLSSPVERDIKVFHHASILHPLIGDKGTTNRQMVVELHLGSHLTVEQYSL